MEGTRRRDGWGMPYPYLCVEIKVSVEFGLEGVLFYIGDL